eukprot:s1730_g5.t1
MTPWQASIDAVDLSHEVGTWDAQPVHMLAKGFPRFCPQKVSFADSVDLYVGKESDWDLVCWPHLLGVPHHQALVFDKQQFRDDADDVNSLLAAHAFPQPHPVPELPTLGPRDAVFDNPDAARHVDSPVHHDDTSTDEASSESEPFAVLPRRQKWYSTMIFTLDNRRPSLLWLDWSDYLDMQDKIANVLDMPPDDLQWLYHVTSPPQDLYRSYTEVLIAHRHLDLPAGSLDRLTLTDVEFHSTRPLTPPEVVRKVRALPEFFSRDQLLRGLGLQPFCRRMRNRCLVWINQELISLHAQRLQVEDGDYIRIAIPPGSRQIDHVATRCLARDEDASMFLQLQIHSLPLLDDTPTCLLDSWHHVFGDACYGICPHGQTQYRLPFELPYREEIARAEEVFRPAPQDLIGNQPAAIQELYMHWLVLLNQEELQHDDDGFFTDIVTWFLDMPEHVTCSDSRDVRLRQNFLHWQWRLSEVHLMTFLCTLGYPRAVILQNTLLHGNWYQIVFHHREPQVAAPERPARVKSEWPAPFPIGRTTRPLLDLQTIPRLEADAQLITALSVRDLHHLFESSFGILQTDFAVLGLPEHLKTELDQLTTLDLQQVHDLDHYDRLLIFTDGSSRPNMKHLAPAHADHLGHPDTWAFVVAAESYELDGRSSVTVLGWTSQPVRYDPLGSAFTGICRIGPDLAERSALIAAALWRLGISHSIPTIVCTDSMTGGGHASGQLGANHPDDSFLLLRSLFQALNLPCLAMLFKFNIHELTLACCSMRSRTLLPKLRRPSLGIFRVSLWIYRFGPPNCCNFGLSLEGVVGCLLGVMEVSMCDHLDFLCPCPLQADAAIPGLRPGPLLVLAWLLPMSKHSTRGPLVMLASCITCKPKFWA